MKQSKRIVSKTTIFLMIFVILTALHGVVLFYLYQNQYKKDLSLILKSQENMIEFEKSRISREFQSIFQDLLFLERVAEVSLSAESAPGLSIDNNSPFYRYFSLLGDLGGRYENVQIVSTEGDELFRLEFTADGQSEIVPDDKLKKGSQDYYFQILENNADSLYVSKIRLAVENGKIKEPHAINIRFGRAVTNDAGEIIAYIIFDYKGNHIIDFLGEYEILPEENFNTYLINNEGYLLNAPDDRPVFAFQFPELEHNTLSKELPDLWLRLQMNISGTFSLNNSLFVYYRFDAEEIIPHGNLKYLGEESLDHRSYFLVFETPHKVLKSLSNTIVRSLFIPFLVTQLIIMLLSILVSKWADRLQRYQQKLLHFSSMDEMTGCMNRRTGRKILENYLSLSRRRSATLTVVYLDLNNLKTVNDKLGHREGDHYILTMVDLIKEQLRNTDFFIRMGGDEFLLILPDCCKTEALKIRKRVLVKEYKLNNADIYPYTLGMSWGILEITAEQNITVPQILAQADKLMYEEKRNYPKVDDALIKEMEDPYSDTNAESSLN